MPPIPAKLSITSRDGMVFMLIGPMTVGMPPKDAVEIAVRLMEAAAEAYHELNTDHEDDMEPEDSCDD